MSALSTCVGEFQYVCIWMAYTYLYAEQWLDFYVSIEH